LLLVNFLKELEMKFLKLVIVIFLGFFLLTLPVLAQEFPQPTGYVNDFAQMLSSNYRQSLEEELVNFEKETTTEIAVVTINSLEGGSIEDYAVRLFEDWQIGKKEKDNGLLILIAKEDREMRIEVGYGLEPLITDGRAGRIIREQMRPDFREEDYDTGVRLAIGQIENYIRSGEPPTGVEEVQEKTMASLPLIVFAVIILIYLSSFLARSKRFWPGGVIGGVMGSILGLIIGTLFSFVLLVAGLSLLGLILDYLLSKNYKKLKKAGKSTGFWGSGGGFFSGGGHGGGFGGFSGGSSGGAGASGSW
jgi:uncharacterized protein